MSDYPTEKLFLQLFLDRVVFSVIVGLSDFTNMDPSEQITEKITVLEMEIGFLRTVRSSPNPRHSIVAGEIELKRMEELDGLKRELADLRMSA